MDLLTNKKKIFETIRLSTEAANRTNDSVSVIAVTKYVDSTIAG